MNEPQRATVELKAFLSHRYKSPRINLFLFELLSQYATVHFEVDVGTHATNVTRLERMIRNSDAFIGLYPFPADPAEPTQYSDLVAASRYFRLEIDIAVRARTPILVFFDQRYGDVLVFPETARMIPFDVQEVTGQGGFPQEARMRRAIGDFVRLIQAAIIAEAERPLVSPRTKVGLIVPTIGRAAANYSEDEVQEIRRVANEHQIPELIIPPEPLVLNGQIYRWLDSLDWAIVDVGETMMKTGIVGYLHSSLIPMLRLYKGVESLTQVVNKSTFRCLFGGVEVGYNKDIVFWHTKSILGQELAKRLQTLRSPVRRITTWESAQKYFLSAARRNEAVFISYSGRDKEIAHEISELLKQSFQEVFDYQDGSSITPGQPWLKEIFNKLAKSALGVQLISKNYLSSGNCVHEAQEMIAQQDAGKMVVIPIKVKEEDLELPTWMRNLQYIRLWKYPDSAHMVEKLIESFDLGTAS